MPHRDDIVAFCNDLLQLHDYPDYGPMGLQYTGSDEVTKVAVAVSVSKGVIEAAGGWGANMLLVHHGLFWNNEAHSLDKRSLARLEALGGHDMSILAYHLALDAHDTIGNNKLAAKALGLRKIKPFGEIGWGGEFKDPMPHSDLIQLIFAKYCAGVLPMPRPNAYWYGSNPISKVAVLVGGAAHYIVQAQQEGYDTFFTGEPAEPSLYLAQDLEMNFIAAGHDATERSGVQQLAKILKRRFQLQTKFFPVNNPV